MDSYNTTRLLLRSLSSSDLPSFHSIFSNPASTYWTPREPSETLEQSFEYLNSLLSRPPELAKHVVLLGETVIGIVGVYRVEEEAQEAEVGYIFSDNYWGKGYATEALEAFMKWYGKERGRNEGRVYLGKVKKGNDSSVRVLEKCGFVRVPELEEEATNEGLVVMRKVES